MSEFYRRAWAAYQLGRYDLCQECIADGLRDDPCDVELVLLLGYVKYETEDYAAARGLGQNAIELDPDDPRGYSILAWATISDLNHSPSDPNFVPQSSDAAKASDERIEVGRKLAMRCLELDPEWAAYYALLAELEFMSEQPELALQAADNGLRVNPEDASCTRARIRALDKLRRLDEAIETGLRRLRLEPEDAGCHHQLAKLYLESRDIAAATRHARQAVRLQPAKPEHRQTYWDTIKSRNPWLRPFVYWQFIAKRLSAIPSEAKTIGLVAVPVVTGLLAAIVSEKFGFEGAPVLMLLVVGLGTCVLASERPCMTLVDMVMFVTDPDYRASVDRRELALHAAATWAALALIACLALAGFSIYTPLLVFVAAVIFAAPVGCLFLARSWKSRSALLLNLVIMAVCLGIAIDLYDDSRPGTPRRIYSMYGFMGFLFAGIAAPVLYGHFRKTAI